MDPKYTEKTEKFFNEMKKEGIDVIVSIGDGHKVSLYEACRARFERSFVRNCLKDWSAKSGKPIEVVCSDIAQEIINGNTQTSEKTVN
jgi:hypothetical protein